MYVWLAWSVKESVYKFLKRHQPALVFSPTKIIFQSIIPPNKREVSYTGTVIFNGAVFYYQSEVTDEYVNTIVNDNESFADVKWAVREINPSNNAERSAMAKAFLLNELQRLFGNDIQVGKSPGGYPVILQKDIVLAIAISLSHDGRFVVYSVKLN